MNGRYWVFVLTVLLTIPLNAEEGASRHSLFTRVLQRHVQDGLVDYAGIAADSNFSAYLGQLSGTDPDTMADSMDHLALWINAYNAYTIKLIIDEKPATSIRDISLGLPILFGPWSISFANVGGTEYTLNAIEHDIIRDRFKDARIHCALVCASRSCPKLRAEAYEGSVLDRQLDEEAERFVNDPSLNRIDVGDRRGMISKIFDWYESDFVEYSGSVRMFLARYLSSAGGRDLLREEDVEFDFLPYDWSLNAQSVKEQERREGLR